MGSDYQPIVAIGLRLSRDQLYDVVPKFKNNCICDIKSPAIDGVKFCHACGRQVAREIRESVPKYAGLRGFEQNHDVAVHDCELKGWPLNFGTDDHFAYVCLWYARGEYGLGASDSLHPLPDLSKLDEFKESMKEAGFWDRDKFGVWVIQYHSY